MLAPEVPKRVIPGGSCDARSVRACNTLIGKEIRVVPNSYAGAKRRQAADFGDFARL